jgi:hypothetical protein
MSDATDNKAWPGTKFCGEPERYAQYATDQEGWAITNDDDEFLESRDPSTIPRVEAPYTVQPGVTNDPHGPPGTNVQMETLGNYNRRIARDAKRSKKLWGEGIRGFGGEALETALTAKKYDARALFRKIKEVHGDKSAKQVSKMVRTFNARNKLPSEGIESFNNEWLSGLRLMKANNMELPEAYVVNLYMASLGDAYRMLESMVQVLPAKERTLQKVMKLAVDHRTDERDEADNSGIALAAEQTKKRKREQALAAIGITPPRGGCTNCGDPYHTAAECFKAGGGLAHLNKQQRGAWLEQRRRQRDAGKAARYQQQQQYCQYQYPPFPHMSWHAPHGAPMPPLPPGAPPAQQQQQQQPTGEANSALEQSRSRVIAALEEKLRVQQQQMDTAKSNVHQMLPGYDIGF